MRKPNDSGRARQPKQLLEAVRKEAQARPDDPNVMYHLALTELDRGSGTLPARNLRRARIHLDRLVQLRPKMAGAHALLAYVACELGDAKAALGAIRTAVRLSPKNQTYGSFLLELLDQEGRHAELQRKMADAARSQGVSLSAVRLELRDAGLRTDVSTVRLNAFPAGRAHFASELFDATEELRRMYLADTGSEKAEAMAARRGGKLDARKVPLALRRAVPLARLWGIPDDAHRGYHVSRINAAERKALRKSLPAGLRRRINAWLDSFPAAGPMSTEAACFMYLLEAYDEVFPRSK